MEDHQTAAACDPPVAAEEEVDDNEEEVPAKIGARVRARAGYRVARVRTWTVLKHVSAPLPPNTASLQEGCESRCQPHDLLHPLHRKSVVGLGESLSSALSPVSTIP